MKSIQVPRPPKEAFNKDRPVSDLIRSQVEHFRHVESKLPQAQRSTLPQDYIRTEHEAAQYISEMTALLLSQSTPSSPIRPAPTVMSRRTSKVPANVIDVAANAGPQQTSPQKKSRPSKRTKGQTQQTYKGKKG
jgi:hypothetical protein